MAKAGKKESGTRQPTSRNGAGAGAVGARGKGRKATVEVVEVVEVAAGIPPAPLTALPPATPAAPTGGDGAAVLRAALADAAALRDELRAVREEVAALKAQASAAAVEVAELRHLCKQTGEKLVAELGDQSLALSRVRQVREQADELGRGIGQAEIRALRDECVKSTEALGQLTEGIRSALREALAHPLDSVRRLSEEVESLRSRVAEIRPSADADEAGDETPAAAEGEGKKNRFGVTVAAGVVAADVTAGSPAEAAGVLRGDVIEEANGVAVHSGIDLLNQTELVAPGGDLTLQIRRGGELVVRTVKLGEPRAEGGSRFGVTVAPGVVVAQVFAGSPAEAAGLARGDVIEDAGGRPVHSGEQLLAIIHAQPEGAEVPLVFTRAGKRSEVVAHLDRA